MVTTLLQPDAVVLPHAVAPGACVSIEAGTVRAIGAPPAGANPTRIAGTLLPGAIDLQVNGAGGHGVDEGDDAALDAIAAAIALGGTAAFLPTLITAPFETLLARIVTTRRWIARGGHVHALPLGLHVEGPFLQAAGAHDATAFVDPTPERVDALLEAGGGWLRLVTLAHARRGAADAVRRFVAAGVAVALGHCDDVTGFDECVDAGATAVTHLFNAMGKIHHRDPGVAGRALDEPRLACTLIVDGHHVHPTMVRHAFRLLGPERTILVTDAAAAAGMSDGSYRLSGIPIELRGGAVRDADGRLAGSALTMERAVARLRDDVQGVGPWTVARVTAAGPARLLGRHANGLGAIEPGARARFSVLSADGRLHVLAYDTASARSQSS